MTARIQTYSGLLVDPLHLSIQDIRLEDIAHALSNLCRFTGHTSQFYSVAEHSVWVSYLAPGPYMADALIHDASEAYLQDIPSPLKQLPEFTFYREAERRAMDTIREALGLLPYYRDGMADVYKTDFVVTAADHDMLHFEATEFLHAPWANRATHNRVRDRLERRFGLGVGCDPKEAKQMFLDRAAELGIE